VVVASRNRRDDLLASLPRHEAPVVLVDNASTDDTVAAVRDAHPEVTVLTLDRNVGARARTVGVERAGTEFVAFADDDSWWAPGDLGRAVDLLRAHPRCALVNARILIGPEERPDPICAEMAASPLPATVDLPGPAILGFVACAAIVRTEAFAEVGGFDDVVRFPGEEERLALDLAAADWQLAYVEDVVAHHHPSQTRGPTLRRQALERRNELLTAVMRRPWPIVGAMLRDLLRAGPAGRRGALGALRRLPAALARRRTLPAPVEAARRRLDG
jgi:GT2 family glycosyltransferase